MDQLCTRTSSVPRIDGWDMFIFNSVIFPAGNSIQDTAKLGNCIGEIDYSENFSKLLIDSSALLQDNPNMGNTITIGDMACIAAATLTAVQVMTPANPIGSSVRLMKHLRKQVRTYP